MNRRAITCFIASVPILAAALVAKAQTRAAVRRIGILDPERPSTSEEREPFQALLLRFGWIEGQNLIVERRFADGKLELLHPFAEELARLKVELIITNGTPSTLAAMAATRTIPIVIAAVGDPVRAGLVASMRRPGGNVTGFSLVSPETDAKRLAVLRELLPSLRRVGILENSSNPYYRAARDDLNRASLSIGVQPIFVEVADEGDLAGAVSEVVRQGAQGLLVRRDFNDHSRLMRAAAKHALPTAVPLNYTDEDGWLLSYDYQKSEQDSRVASFVDRILRGAKPAELPIEQPTVFDLRINLKTAKVLGINVPQSMLVRAVEVIQ